MFCEQLKRRREETLGRDVLESAKLADRKLIFVPLLLFMGRFWGILRCCLAFGGHTSKTIHPIDKALHTLQVFLKHLFLHLLSVTVVPLRVILRSQVITRLRPF